MPRSPRAPLAVVLVVVLLMWGCSRNADTADTTAVENTAVENTAVENTAVEATPTTTDPAPTVASDQTDNEPAPAAPSPATLPPPGESSPAYSAKTRLERTINLGAVLEIPRTDTPWGPDLDDEDFAEIAAAGFSAVRIPVKFSDWAAADAPYEIDTSLLDRLDAALDAAEANDLAAIIDLHHYDEINLDPAAHQDRLAGMWREIAGRYGERPVGSVFYEVLNEPNNNLDAELWNEILADTVAAIREIDSQRTIIVGPGNWNDNNWLPMLELPEDTNLLVTFHYYSPFEFTHQGAVWVNGSDAWLGTRWGSADTGNGAETAGEAIDREFAAVAEWARERNVPVLLGEFGVLDNADQNDRIKWVRWVREAAENNGFAWAYWDWAAPGFGMQNDETNEWDVDILGALLP